jgi:hypothetical protein
MKAIVGSIFQAHSLATYMPTGLKKMKWKLLVKIFVETWKNLKRK